MFYISIAQSKSFEEAPAKVAPPVTSKPKQEEEVAPPVIDLVLLSLVDQSVVQQQATPGDLPVAKVETESVSSTRTASEQGED